MTSLLTKEQQNICGHNDYCGGCLYQGVPYADQVAAKEREVLRLMENKGVEIGEYLGIVPSPSVYRYRNKMEYTFGDMEIGGEMTLGMHRKGKYMCVVTVDGCQLVDGDFNTVLRATLDFCNERGYRFCHKKTHKGLMRHLIVRKGIRTGELLVNIVTTSQEPFDEDGYTAMLLGLQETGKLSNTLVGILHTINDAVADAVVCDSLKTLWGRDHYFEEIMGLRFRVSAFSFFQTNVEAVERLYESALAMIPDVSGKTVYDLYCGTGTITQSLAKSAKRAVGVEIVEESVVSARENSLLNGIVNCEFIAGDVLKVLDDLTEKPDVIVVDPPRVGINPKALAKICAYGVDEILYISCNPKTLADNLKVMAEYGYEAVKLQAFDNFPMTKHIECAALLTKNDTNEGR